MASYLISLLTPLQIALVDSDEQVDEDDGWEYVPLSDQQKFGVKTAGLEDKNTACQMLVCYARELKEGFSEYTEQVVKIMVPLLKFYFHDLIRSAAAESLPFLLESVKHKVDMLKHGHFHNNLANYALLFNLLTNTLSTFSGSYRSL